MIGGIDIVFACKIRINEANYIITKLKTIWQNLVVQDAGMSDLLDLADDSIPREFFIYRSKADFDSWQKVGLDPDNRDGMVYVIIKEDHIAVVLDDHGMSDILKAIRQAIEDKTSNRGYAKCIMYIK